MEQFLPQEFIRTKRDGGLLSTSEIKQFVTGITDGSMTEGQVAAFAMSVFFNGLTADEQVDLTSAMTSSGDVLDWSLSNLDGPVVDKHSTGGVGDKVSLILAPIVAACGAYVPMISGRGLGHTGGTLDKFESIPGYSAELGVDRFFEVVKKVGCSVIGQTAALAPADKRFYAIRDITATVESIPLMTASILSKKLSAGLEGLVMDIKYGSGSFMGCYDRAHELGANIVRVANQAGLPTRAVLTDMGQVLGLNAGNAVEVVESVDFLTGKRQEPRLRQITLQLAAQMLLLSGMEKNLSKALGSAELALDAGKAAEVFGKMVSAHGGPVDFVENKMSYMDVAPIVKAVYPSTPGFVSEIDVRGIGLAVVALGGGRVRADQEIDHAVGLTDFVNLGDGVDSDRPLCILHARDQAAASQAEKMILSAACISEEQVVVDEQVIGDILSATSIR